MAFARTLALALALVAPAVALHPFDDAPRARDDASCVAPGTCTAPDLAYSAVAPVVPRKQWGNSGGFCGSLSVQAIALTYGTWISQSLVRKAAGPGGGHGNKLRGYEILHTNIGGALDNLGLAFDAFDYVHEPTPQSPAFLRFLKQHLVAGEPIVWFIMCKARAAAARRTKPNNADSVRRTPGSARVRATSPLETAPPITPLTLTLLLSLLFRATCPLSRTRSYTG